MANRGNFSDFFSIVFLAQTLMECCRRMKTMRPLLSAFSVEKWPGSTHQRSRRYSLGCRRSPEDAVGLARLRGWVRVCMWAEGLGLGLERLSMKVDWERVGGAAVGERASEGTLRGDD